MTVEETTDSNACEIVINRTPDVRKHAIYLIPLLADQAASEQGLRVQPVQQVESQLQWKEAQEISLEQCLQSIRQMTELGSTA